jgi:hypothetical protein
MIEEIIFLLIKYDFDKVISFSYHYSKEVSLSREGKINH